MHDRGLSQRQLARLWRPDDPETARRSIRRYLDGMVPHDRTKQELARAMGSEETEPSSSSEDDKEGSLLAELRMRLLEAAHLMDEFEGVRGDKHEGMVG